MIATGGLLRMNRRQDSQRSKNHAENKRRRKLAKRRKKNDIVVVKGKLSLLSPSGLVAALGLGVLMVGIAMAVLGYWPHEGHSQGYATRVSPGAERRGNGRMSYSKSPRMSANWSSSKTHNDTVDRAAGGLAKQTGVAVNGSSSVPVNRSVSVSAPPPSTPTSVGFVSEFLDRYLYSDNLKVFGPLVMGIGIFLFICANAVLHENRDQKTKVINLRDIYSTVIDLHSKRTKNPTPINGSVSYAQCRGGGDLSSGGTLNRGTQSSATAPSNQGPQQARRSSMAARQQGWSRGNQTFTDTVYSIYRDQKRRCSEQSSYPREWEGTASIVTSSVNAFTLPVIKLNNCEVRDEGVQVLGEDTDCCSDDEIIRVQDFSEDAIGEQLVPGSSQALNIRHTHPSRRALLNPQQAYSPGFNTNEKGLPRKCSLKDASRMTLVLSTPQEDESPTTIKPPRAEQEQSLSPLSPISPVSRETADTGSRLSLSSLNNQEGGVQPQLMRRCSLSLAACRQGGGARRLSCPRLDRSNSKGYLKLETTDGESFEAQDLANSCSPDSHQEGEKEVDLSTQGGGDGVGEGKVAIVTRSCS
ncbi:transmembrane protein 200A [Esox lucius]|uniref:Transmembrane protein 200C n=1 Tax=Esox lucius TaxID=8010 RepID=A0AAY5KS94_ESOLU|nr:transmembrane protein 200A [Esox lucius]